MRTPPLAPGEVLGEMVGELVELDAQPLSATR
jgi:hypothetical protein